MPTWWLMNIAGQIERRVSYRRAMKRAIQQAMRQGAQGIKIEVAGRLSGAEMARTVWLREGRVPLQTLRADMDFARAEALTTYGRLASRCGFTRARCCLRWKRKSKPPKVCTSANKIPPSRQAGD